jgi:hypothetical protein
MKVYKISFESGDISILGASFEEVYKQAKWVLDKASKAETLQDELIQFKGERIRSIIEQLDIYEIIKGA